MGKADLVDPKARSQRRHAKLRAVQRLGLPNDDLILEAFLDGLAVRIRERLMPLLRIESRRVSVYALVHHGKHWEVVWDHQRHQVVTFLQAPVFGGPDGKPDPEEDQVV